MRRRSRLPRYADAKFVITAVCAMLEMRTRNAERSVGNTGRYGCYCVQPYGSGPMRRSAIDPGAPVLEPPVKLQLSVAPDVVVGRSAGNTAVRR